MKKIMYAVSLMESTWMKKNIEKGVKPITLKNMQVLKSKRNIGVLFFRHEEEVQAKHEIPGVSIEAISCRIIYEKKYYIGKEYNYNDLPKGVNRVDIRYIDKKALETQNPKCVVARNGLVVLLEDCGDYETDESEKVVIDPDDLDKIKEITKDGIVYESQNDNQGADNQENEEGMEQ